ncbi:MAG: hypothetical protein ACI9KE_005769 [Polyangiales bacterium]|jgi:hypothetical protein
MPTLRQQPSSARFGAPSKNATLLDRPPRWFFVAWTGLETRGAKLLTLLLAVVFMACNGPGPSGFDAGLDAGLSGDAPGRDAPPVTQAPLTDGGRPVVLLGLQLPTLTETPTNRLEAYAFRGGWERVPLQVDERDLRTLEAVYGPGRQIEESNGDALRLSFYTNDPHTSDYETYVGVDGTAGLDNDDEVSFFLRDAGACGEQAPPTLEQVAVVQVALDRAPDDVRCVFIGMSAAGADPLTATVVQTFELLNGMDLPSYDTNPSASTVRHPSCQGDLWSGANEEDSTVRTDLYERHFSGRWASDGLRIGDSADILDAEELRVAGPDVEGLEPHCRRSANSFSNGRGVVATVKSGPVRAIRSYLGANSGPGTQRTHFYYPDREVVETHVRVHAIPGAFSEIMDLSSDAEGLRYLAPSVRSGVVIDGRPDNVPSDPNPWELVTGTPNNSDVALAMLLIHDIEGYPWPHAPSDVVQVFVDDGATPNQCVCSGEDEVMIGGFGRAILPTKDWYESSAPLHYWPSTDPLRPDCAICPEGDADQHRIFLALRTSRLYYDRALDFREAEEVFDAERSPLRVTTRPMTGCDGDCDSGCWPGCDATPVGCGDGVCIGGETNFLCPEDCSDGALRFCGDGICDPSEDSVLCPGECESTSPTLPLLQCLASECSALYATCVASGCIEGLRCVEDCRGATQSCAQSCVPAEDAATYSALAACGLERCDI